jgi:hypothetical protein
LHVNLCQKRPIKAQPIQPTHAERNERYSAADGHTGRIIEVKKPVEILDLHLESPFVYRSELVVPDLKVYQQLSYIWDG